MATCFEQGRCDDIVPSGTLTHFEKIRNSDELFPILPSNLFSECFEKLDVSVFISDDDIFLTFFLVEKTLQEEESGSGASRMRESC